MLPLRFPSSVATPIHETSTHTSASLSMKMRSAYELVRRPLASRICLVFANLIDFPHVLSRARRSSSMMALWRSYSPDEARGQRTRCWCSSMPARNRASQLHRMTWPGRPIFMGMHRCDLRASMKSSSSSKGEPARRGGESSSHAAPPTLSLLTTCGRKCESPLSRRMAREKRHWSLMA